MEDFNNPTGQNPFGQSETGTGTAARMKLSEKASEVKEKVADFGRNAIESIDSSREGAAGAMERTADTLHSGGDRLSSAAHTAASKLQASADYVRTTNLRGMAADVQDVVKRYPGQSLAIAAILGFLVARGFRSDSH